MEHVQVLEPSTMERIAGTVYMGVTAIFALDYGVAVPVVTGEAVALSIRRRTIARYVEVVPTGQPNCAAAFLKVATPSVALTVQGGSIWKNVEPSILRMDRGDALVESERSDMAWFVGFQTVGGDVVRA